MKREKLIEQAKILYDLKLHESIGLNNHFITRVPGGWLYREMSTPNSNSVFVPFNNEFKEWETQITGAK